MMRLFLLSAMSFFLSMPVWSEPAFDPLPESGIDLACQTANQRNKVPPGEYCCSIAPDDRLCWKSGPIRIIGLDGMEIPYYFELTEDYEIDPYSFFNDENDPDHVFRSMALNLWYDFNPYNLESIKWDFIDIPPPYHNKNRLEIKKGYRWDGASRGVAGEWATLLFNLRSSLVHDALYDLLRLDYLPNTDDKFDCEIYNDYRHLADKLFYLIAVEDGHKPSLAEEAYHVLRGFGCWKANNHSEENASWRFHTLANAQIYPENGKMLVDDDGKKSLAITCASKSDRIMLYSRRSRPIADIPQAGKYHNELHITSWEWNLNDKILVPRKQNVIDELLNPDDEWKEMTLEELTEEEEWNPGVNSVVLHIDNPKVEEPKNNIDAEEVRTNQSSAPWFYENIDEVEMTVEFDTEPPVISGVSESIPVRSRNHKYMTFTIGDFVSGVTDDCTNLSLDDLVITSVMSSEPDNSRGGGDGNTANDIVIATDRKSVTLRIERQGRGGGRTYTINIEAVDENNNSTIESYKVEVRHDGKK